LRKNNILNFKLFLKNKKIIVNDSYHFSIYIYTPACKNKKKKKKYYICYKKRLHNFIERKKKNIKLSNRDVYCNNYKQSKYEAKKKEKVKSPKNKKKLT